MDGTSLLQTACQGLFLLVITVLLLNWIAPRFKAAFKTRTRTETDTAEEDKEHLEYNRHQQDECRQRYQELHNEKASDYNNRILKPREDEKRRKKEEDFQRFLGPAWKGPGFALGGGNGGSSTDNESCDDTEDGRKAAKKRSIPEQINERVATAAAASAAKRQKPIRIITLPEEPDVNEAGVICVMLRTPIGTIHQRRFYATDKVQCLLDYITTIGFHQKRYSISTTYPRMLIDDPELCLADHNFGRRVALNIEEKD